jgi:hypothetical protein
LTRPEGASDKQQPLARRARVLIVCVVLCLAGVAAATPGLRSPVARLANYDADPPGPHYDVPVDGAPLARAGSILPDSDRVTYLVYAPTAGPVLLGNLRAAMRLYAFPALPVLGAERAEWVLSYVASRLLPRALRARRVYPLGRGVALVETAR